MTRQPDTYDFFVSYARRDNRDGWITAFLNALQEEHRRHSGDREFGYFFDKDGIRSLDSWQHVIYEKLAASRLLVAFISPAYFMSEWCRREWTTWIDLEIAKHILSDGAATVYIVEVPWLYHEMREQEVAAELDRLHEDDTKPLPGGMASAARDLAGQIRLRQQTSVKPFYDRGLDALREADLRKVLDSLARDLDSRSEHVQAAARSRSTIPPYNRRFVGRLDELTRLRKMLHSDHAGVIASVHGLGGIGKTELAFTYAHAFAGLYPGGRFLVECEHESDLRQAMLKLDAVFGDKIDDEQRKSLDLHFGAIREALRDRLGEMGRILLVLDNVTDTALIGPEQTDALRVLGPQLHMLATTRLGSPVAQDADDYVTWLTLGELSFGESLRLLEKHRPSADDAEREAAERIARRLGGFALCVEVVGAYLRQHPELSYVEFLETMGLADLEQVDDAAERKEVQLRRHNNEKRLGAILTPTLAALSPVERTALEFAALLPADQVALPWLKELVGDERSDLDDASWEQAWHRLFALALFTRGGRGGDGEEADLRIARCHRLVQDHVRDRLADGLPRRDALSDLVTRRDAFLEGATDWQENRWEVEPLDALARLWDETGHRRAAWLLNQVGQRWDILAEWTRAEGVMRRALAIAEQTHGRDHFKVAISLNNLAGLCQATGRLPEAIGLFRRALTISEKHYGSDHPEVALRLNNLAGVLYDTNCMEEAEPLFRRALAIREATCPPLHPDIAQSLNNLALLLKDTNRLLEAEPLFRRALDIWQASLGADHPSLALGLVNLGVLLCVTRRYTEAEGLLRRALQIQEASYGPDHPEVGRSLCSLAEVLRATDRLDEAESLHRRALAIRESRCAPDHPDVADSLNALAIVLTTMHRAAQAEPLYRRAIAIYEASLGEEHPRLAASCNNLAQLLHADNRLIEAEALFRRALAIWEKGLGEDHPLVGSALNNLAALFYTSNRSAEAEPLFRRSLAIDARFTHETGSEHPELRKAIRNYETVLDALGLGQEEIRKKIGDVLQENGLMLGEPSGGAADRQTDVGDSPDGQ